MKVYKIRHKPTGLFYQPVKGRWKDTKTHLGPNGKVYIARKPNLKDILHFIQISDKQKEKYNFDGYEYRDSRIINDFEILEYELKEGVVTE